MIDFQDNKALLQVKEEIEMDQGNFYPFILIFKIAKESN